VAEPPGTGPPGTGPPPLTAVLVGFCAELRRAGLPAGTGDVLAYATAAAALDPSDLVDLYWAGRVTLVTRRDAIPRYDAVFRRYFLGADPGPAADVLALTPQAVAQAQAVLDIPATEPPDESAEEEQQETGCEGATTPDLATRRPSWRPPRTRRHHRCYGFPLVHVR